MANYANLLATIAANIYTNGNNEVTAAMVKSAVDAMVASLGAGYQFAGVATPSTNPGTPDFRCFYITSKPGTYTNFSGLAVKDGEVAVLYWDTSWHKSSVSLWYNPKPINLFDKDKATTGKYINASGTLGNVTDGFVTDFIPVVVGVTYKINSNYGGNAKICLYDEAFQPIVASIVADSTREITATTGAKYVRFSSKTSMINTTMVCAGNLPAVYVPYAYDGQQIGYNVNKLRWCEPLMNAFSADDFKRIDTTFTDGYIFESAVAGFETSDYIPVTNTFKKYAIYLVQSFTTNYSVIRYYDKDYNVVYDGVGGRKLIDDVGGNFPPSSILNRLVVLNIPDNAEYIRFARGTGAAEQAVAGVYVMSNAPTIGQVIGNAINHHYTPTNYVLWLGTSIPAGAEYPAKSCENNGLSCINKAVGSSQLRFTNTHPSTVQYYSGRCLTATVAELEALYRQDVTDGVITEAQLTEWKNGSYENAVIPYIDGTNAKQASMIVIDHGFNDRNNIHSLMDDEQSIDWESRDRSNYVGAFNYLLDKIFAANPFVKIVVGGYFQNTYAGYYSADICRMQELLAAKYEFPLFDTWNKSGISSNHVPNSSNYLSEYNAEYGTSYVPLNPDGAGNIMFLQLFCPDQVHPHSDLTGNANIRLNGIYTKMMQKIM